MKTEFHAHYDKGIELIDTIYLSEYDTLKEYETDIKKSMIELEKSQKCKITKKTIK